MFRNVATEIRSVFWQDMSPDGRHGVTKLYSVLTAQSIVALAHNFFGQRSYLISSVLLLCIVGVFGFIRLHHTVIPRSHVGSCTEVRVGRCGGPQNNQTENHHTQLAGGG